MGSDDPAHGPATDDDVAEGCSFDLGTRLGPNRAERCHPLPA